MDRAREEPLAGAGLAREQHRGRVRQLGELAGPLEDGPGGGRLSHHGRESDVLGGPATIVGKLLLELAVLARAVGQELQLLQIHGLLDVVEGTELHRLHRAFDRAVGGQHDDREDGIELADPLQEIDPAHPRQPNVREHDIRLQALEQLEGLLTRARDFGLVAVVQQKGFGGPGKGLFVVDDQDGGAVHAGCRAAAGAGVRAGVASPALGSQIRTVVPCATTLVMLSRPPVSST